MLRVRKGFEPVLPSAVIFDTDNTLYPYDPAHEAADKAVTRKATTLLGVSEEEFQEAFARARKETKERLGPTASSHSRLLYFQRTIELLGHRTRILSTLDLEQTYWRVFLAHSRLFPGVVDFIRNLKNEGIVTANITDLTAQIQFRKMVYFGLDEYFDYVVTSEEANRDKPDPRPFELALQKLGIPPQRIWMIGDSAANDMAGAGRAGMVKVQKIHDGVVTHDEGDGVADICFNDFDGLSDFIFALPDAETDDHAKEAAA